MSLRQHVMVVAPRLPEFDREGGSRRVYHLIEMLIEAGYLVSYVAQNDRMQEQYITHLQQMSVLVHNTDAYHNPEKLLSIYEPDIFILVFWNIALEWIPAIRSYSPKSKVIVDSIDLHYLRLVRKAFQQGQEISEELAYKMRMELNTYAKADLVLTVSQKEADLLDEFFVAPREQTFAIPQLEQNLLSPIPLSDREGILFVGNYQHPPNKQAAYFLFDEILKYVPSEILKQHPLYIVGNALPPEIIQYQTIFDTVRMVGWVPSLIPYYNKARITIVPLLTGAGTKTKLIQALMTGTPSVTTTIGAEGLGLENGKQVIIADDAKEFASGIARLIKDDALWQNMTKLGREHIYKRSSYGVVYDKFINMIDTLL